MSLCFVSGTLL